MYPVVVMDVGQEVHILKPIRTNLNDIVSKCVQVAFIVAGSTHMGCYKTLKHALGIDVVHSWIRFVMYVSHSEVDAGRNL